MELESYIRAAVTWFDMAQGKNYPKGSVRAGPHTACSVIQVDIDF